MLTQEAFNALLKTLEEPPEHVKFIFATTAPYKVLPTIISRCQRFDFKRIAVPDLIEKLKLITKEEKLKVEEKAFFAIARGVEGSMRDALSLLDQLISFSEGNIREEEVNAVLGMVDEEILFALVEAIVKEDTLSSLKLVDKVISQGKDLRLFSTNLIQHFRNMMMLRVGGEAAGLVELPEDSIKRMKTHCNHFSLEEIEEAMNTLSQTAEALRWTESARIPLELAVIKLTKMKTVPAIPAGDPEKNPSQEVPAPVTIRKVVPEKNPPGNEPVSGTAPENSPAEKGSGETLSLEKVKEQWSRVLECIKEKKITAEAFLREGEPTKVSEKILTVTFPPAFNFHKEVVEKNETRRVIEGVLRDVFRHDLMIHPVLDRSSSPPENNSVQTGAKNGEDELNRILDKEPVMKAALDTFGAKVVEVKKI
jgi:DNA polymerase-3 subunit gamma/tau